MLNRTDKTDFMCRVLFILALILFSAICYFYCGTVVIFGVCYQTSPQGHRDHMQRESHEINDIHVYEASQAWQIGSIFYEDLVVKNFFDHSLSIADLRVVKDLKECEPKTLQSLYNASCYNVSRVMGKPTFWFPTWSDTNSAVQLQKIARGLKFRI